jgi:hypothetical protein
LIVIARTIQILVLYKCLLQVVLVLVLYNTMLSVGPVVALNLLLLLLCSVATTTCQETLEEIQVQVHAATCDASGECSTRTSISGDTKDPLEQAAEFGAFLRHMFDAVETHAATLTKPDLNAQESLILTTWLSYLKMDPALFTTTPATVNTSNWLETLHRRTHQMAPAAFFRIWDERARPTQDEIQIALAMMDDDDAPLIAATDKRTGQVQHNVLMGHLFEGFRHRGFIMVLLDNFSRVLLRSLKTISYAIPSQQNLDLIARYAPLMEVGAGTGYWTAMLQARNVTITAYDAEPATQAGGMYFDRTYTDVKKATCLQLFNNNNDDQEEAMIIQNNNHTLLMVWPNNPDNIDNAPEFHSPRLPPVWDLDCVEAFLKAGGTTLILVAERETNIHVLPSHPPDFATQPDSGLCASRALQTLLDREFDLVNQMSIPTWLYRDDLTVWVKKADTLS